MKSTGMFRVRFSAPTLATLNEPFVVVLSTQCLKSPEPLPLKLFRIHYS